jgi:hypothetical protein
MRNLRALGVFLIFAVLAAAGPLRADVRVELGFGWSMISPAFSTSYLNQFAPPMTPAANAISSSATQTVRLNGKTGFGISGFLNILLNERFGIQVLVDGFRPGLGGANPAYDVNLTYFLTDPNDPYVYSKQGAWPGSRGDFSETTFSLNGIVRFPVAKNLSINLSGGASAFNLKGQATPIGFWSFRLEQPGPGGVDTLYIKTYQLVYDFGPKTTYGLNIGGELAYTVTRFMICSLDVRYFLSRTANFEMHIKPNEGLEDPAEPIESAMHLGVIKVDPSYLRACLTLWFRF